MEYGHMTGTPNLPQQDFERHFCATCPVRGTGRVRGSQGILMGCLRLRSSDTEWTKLF